jgi:hypothetical protein
LKVYLSVPMIANRAFLRAQQMARAIRDSGHELTSPWVLGELDARSSSGVNVFERDRLGAEGCDTIVADATEPSTGVGMELMAAYKAGRKVIVVARKGSPVSMMLRHMEGKVTIEYGDEGEIYDALRRVLAGQGPGKLGSQPL